MPSQIHLAVAVLPQTTPRMASANCRLFGPAECARALEILGRAGYEPQREQQFVAAAQAGTCYLCHMDFGGYMPHCPCPHGLLGPMRKVAECAELFPTFCLADLLHFAVLYSKARHPYRFLKLWQHRRRVGFVIRTTVKEWVLWADLDPQGEAAIEMFHPRSGRTTGMPVAATTRDREILAEVAAACLHRAARPPAHNHLLPLHAQGLPAPVLLTAECHN